MPLIALGVYFLILVGLALVSGYRPFYFLLYFSGAVTALSYLWAWLQTLGLDIEVISVTQRPQVGRPLQLRVTVKERIGLPRIGLGIRLAGDQSGDGEHRIIGLKPKQKLSWTARVAEHRRGLNNIGSAEVEGGEPLGLAKVKRQVGEPESIMVYPSVVAVTAGMTSGTSSLGQMGDLSQILSASTTASRVREYQPGDSLSHIHWPSSAKTNQLMTKEFDSSGQTEIWICLDFQAGGHAGMGRESTEEYGVTIAASLARSMLESGQMVGLVIQGDEFYHLRPQRGLDHYWDVMKALALVKAKGDVSLQRLIALEGEKIGAGSTVVTISPRRNGVSGGISQQLVRKGIGHLPIYLEAASFNQEEGAESSASRRRSLDGAFVVRRGDNLAYSLSIVLDQLVF